MTKLVHPKDLAELKKYMTEGKSVIKFGAHWCPPCVKLGPVLAKIAE